MQSIGGGGGGRQGRRNRRRDQRRIERRGAVRHTVGGLNLSQLSNLGDGILQIGQIGEQIKATLEELGIFSQPQAGEAENGTSVQHQRLGHRRGPRRRGRERRRVERDHTGSIVTFGAQSDGIYAQSVGGGGGSGARPVDGRGTNDAPVQTRSGWVARAAPGAGGPVTVVNGAAAPS